MKKAFILAAPVMVMLAVASYGYCAGPEKIFGDYQADIFEDAKTQMNDKFLQANTKAQVKSGKVTETDGSIGGITVEKGATIFGPIGTNVDTHGADINVISNQKGK